MAKKFKVITLSMSGLNNKIYRSGEIVTADQFATPVKELVKDGFLEELEEVKEEPVKESPKPKTTRRKSSK